MTDVSITCSRLASNRVAGFVIVMVALLQTTLSVRAGELLKHVPNDAAGIVSIRNVREFDARLSNTVRMIKPEMEGLPLADLETTLGFAPGTINLDHRITAIFLHPDELGEFINSEGLGSSDAAYPVIAFDPLHPEEFGMNSDAKSSSKHIHSRQGLWGQYYFYADKGTVFVANRRKSLRVLTRQSEHESLSSRMDPAARDVYEKADVFSHFSMVAWRDRMSPYVSMVGNLVQLGIIAQQSSENVEETDALLKWFIQGAKDAFSQMDSVTLALQIDGPNIRIHHLHDFDRNRWMANYLKSVTRSGEEPFQALPDRPFLAMGYYDWVCPIDQSLSKRMTERLFSLAKMKKRHSEAERAKLIESALKMARELRVTDFVFCNPTGDLFPFEIYGSYTTNAPTEMLEIYTSLNEISTEAWSMFMAGGVGFSGKFTKRSQNGFEFSEMRFDQPGLPEHLVQEVKQAYGDKVSFQMAAVGKNHLTYSIAQPPGGVLSMVESIKQGSSITKNPCVQRIRGVLPKDANIVLIIDLGRLIRGARSFGGWSKMGALSSDGTPARLASGRPDRSNATQADTGPLLGWSCRAGAGSLNCQIDVDGIELAKLFSTLAKEAPGKH